MSQDTVFHKVIELMTVTDETISEALNEMTAAGWMFEDIKFAMRDASKRPSMAFLFFVKTLKDGDPAPGPRVERRGESAPE